ncbi:uncharacterized protein L3040_002982 [Drepanopeziza brunnea f. sp. 'multigermtubi']|uniref:2EXR domain-containing protein n=1 Tax=Marssonina brunnea f. sp. multigermtubi (strain MB_m1) TaxID=1072389 RepID=K1W7U9_MARBU|nr:uncharacterized protein MBM_08623 [Drepanopeziza brunnea f. sp. 'multigermtubi' MB_m1]EKD13180.1 hypothetical protein MBM_08623 [Drepanopeziza brunnea f. sp. 'multigermtubi' MB_m1]KAJ5047140.1 hypothetical protein L3040_002982 [Drepanopeziza brunnea f. sp. 'multigermtubi']
MDSDGSLDREKDSGVNRPESDEESSREQPATDSTESPEWEPVTSFTFFERLPIELKTMIFKEATPDGSIIQVSHTTYIRKDGKRGIAFNVDKEQAAPDNKGAIKNYRIQRAIGLLGACKTSRDIYLTKFPHQLVMHHQKSRKVQSVFRFSASLDILYLATFRSQMLQSIPFPRTYEALQNESWSEHVTRLIFGSTLARYSFSPGVMRYEPLLAVFPRVREIKLAHHKLRQSLEHQPLVDYHDIDPNAIIDTTSPQLPREVAIDYAKRMNEVIKSSPFLAENNLPPPVFVLI